MHPFTYSRATDPAGAVATVAADARASFLAGGTTLVDLMKLGVERPERLVDVNRLPLGEIQVNDAGARIEAMVRNSDLAWHEGIRRHYPALSQALLSGASPQLRNMATVGGNLMQRTRCTYFRDGISACNKREPGAGCAAAEGFNRSHAVLGTSEKCAATHASDMCVALAAYEATIVVRGAAGERRIPIGEFYVSAGDDPARETVLGHGELIVAVELGREPWHSRAHYLKVRDRESYEFALASAAVVMDVAGGVIRTVRVALGGVATKPWRSLEAERVLTGAKADEATFQAAADAALAGAKPLAHNAFKIELAKRTLRRALATVAAI